MTLSCLGSLVLLLIIQQLWIIWLSNLSILDDTGDEGFSRNVLCAITMLSTFSKSFSIQKQNNNTVQSQ